jgi:hypothetical protein
MNLNGGYLNYGEVCAWEEPRVIQCPTVAISLPIPFTVSQPVIAKRSKAIAVKV